MLKMLINFNIQELSETAQKYSTHHYESMIEDRDSITENNTTEARYSLPVVCE